VATPSRLAITWLGHSTFLVKSPGATRVLFDPWLVDNPRCPDSFKHLDQVDLILVSHAHHDHFDDVEPVARRSGAAVVANVEICRWLERRGLKGLHSMNTGGTTRVKDLTITMVPALHSSSLTSGGEILALGNPVGFVVAMEAGPSIYFAGDTALFGDMTLIREMHHPDIAMLPIGDRYTMGPDAAAQACRMLGVRQAIPMHYDTFPSLTGTVTAFRALVEPLGVQVLELRPGETAQ
jgi:L-ascorbate metabolism protein UlaG (beta-lactamase superfamily)